MSRVAIPRGEAIHRALLDGGHTPDTIAAYYGLDVTDAHREWIAWIERHPNHRDFPAVLRLHRVWLPALKGEAERTGRFRRPAEAHPRWCDTSRCQSGALAGAEHRSAPCLMAVDGVGTVVVTTVLTDKQIVYAEVLLNVELGHSNDGIVDALHAAAITEKAFTTTVDGFRQLRLTS